MRNRAIGADRRTVRDRQRGRRPRFDRLEERQLLTTFTVKNTNDSGLDSFRQAILDANLSGNVGGPDIIQFNITGGALKVIAPVTALPTIDEAVTIDGYSQAGSAVNTSPDGTNAKLQILVTGSNLPAASSTGLIINAPGVTIDGLVMNNFQVAAITDTALGGNAQISGNFIGTDPTGTLRGGNGNTAGIVLRTGGNIIGDGKSVATRNVLTGNGVGVSLSGTVSPASANLVAGNLVGVVASGLTGLGAIPNNIAGILLDNGTTNNTIGGVSAQARNIIASNNAGIRIVGANTSGNLVLGNYIGVDATGGTALANAIGVFVSAPGNTIGGGVQAARNIISGNTVAGVEISTAVTANAINNVAVGNYIGLNVTGTAAVGNGEGVVILGASGNSIGGAALSFANVISGNKDAGISISGAAATGNFVLGNFIGTNPAGNAKIGNVNDGIDIIDGNNNVIGGTFAAARNVISGNGGPYGIQIFANAPNQGSGNLIQGNYIGVSANGNTALTNAGTGVRLAGPGNTVGGVVAGAANVISGNGSTGVQVFTPHTPGNLIAGNFIGTDASGTAVIGNARQGVSIAFGTSTTVGGTAALARNVISGNLVGVDSGSAGVDGSVILGNYIGTDRTGTVALGNGTGASGISLIGSGITVGGTAAGAANVISGNLGLGVDIHGTTGFGNVVLGNKIGTNANGTAALANSLGGVSLDALSNVIGGSVAGAGNIISGNGGPGVSVLSTQTTGAGNTIDGNFIGVDASGGNPLPNTGAGVQIIGASGTTIGGAVAAARNVISGNSSAGVSISGATATGGVVLGNYIGINSAGTTAVANVGDGIALNSPSNTIGGNAVAARNVISGNTKAGIEVQAAATKTVIGANFIGTAAAGASKIANGTDGVQVKASAVTIGGATSAAGNLISGNAAAGISVSSGGDSAVIVGNQIGTNQAVTSALANGTSGIILAGVSSVAIGGTTQASQNVISGNTVDGIQVTGTGGSDLIQSNFIGTDSNGVAVIGNGVWGISVEGPNNVSIGGVTSTTANTILFNGASAVGVTGGVGIKAGAGNQIQFNSISQNTGLGIDLGEDGLTLNSGGSPHSGPNRLQNFPVLQSALSGPASTAISGTLDAAPNSSFILQFFSNSVADGSGYGEGKVFLGSSPVTTDAAGSGLFTATVPVHVNAGQFISATATDPSGNTSEFSLDLVASNAATDLAITITASPEPVQVGQNLTYTITVTNNGPSPATGVTVTDTLPSSVTFVSATTPGGTTAFSAGTVTANLGTLTALPPGNSTTVTIIVKPNVPGQVLNTATVSSNEGDTNSANDSATATSTVIASADLDLKLKGLPSPVLLGQNLTYTLTVTNKGPSTATGVTAIDTLPANVTFVSANTTQGLISRVGNVITVDIGSITLNGATTITIVVKPTATGLLTDTASVSATETDPVSANNGATVITQVNPSADLAVGITASPTPGLVGQPYTYVVTVTNNGQSDATSVSVVDTLPAGVTFVSASTSAGGTFTQAGSTVTGSFPTLISGASATLTIVVTPNSAVSITNTASVSATNVGDPDLSNNTASLTTAISPAANLAITVTDSPDPVSVGQTLIYTVTVTNLGPNTATGVTATNTLPAGVTFSSVSQSQGIFSFSGGVVTLRFGNLSKNAVATATISVRPTPSAAGQILDIVNVSGNEADPVLGNNTASTTTTVSPSSDLGLTLTATPNPVLVGTNLTYVMTVTNAGPSDATNVIVTNTLPAGVSLVSVTPSQGTSTQLGNTISTNLGSILGNGSSATVTIVVTPTPAAAVNITDSASVSSDVADPNSSNNSATVTVRVNPAADLVLDVSDSPDPLLIGGDLTYSFSLINNGPSDATGVNVVDTLPVGAIFKSSNLPFGATIAVNNGVAQITIGNLPTGIQKTFTLVVQPTTTGLIRNDATATAAQNDPSPLNASATTFTTVLPSADVSVTLSALPNTVLISDPSSPGQPLILTANIVNHGPSATTGVVLTETLPFGLTILSATAPGLSPTISGNTITTVVGNLASGGLTTVTIVALPTLVGGVLATASVSSIVQDSDLTNNSATATALVVPSADLAITETASANPAPLHANLTYTVKVTNRGPSTATNVILTDILPAGASFVSATGPDGTSYTPAGTVLTIPLGVLVVGQSATVTIVVMPTAMGTLNNSASVGATEADAVADNSSRVELITAVGLSGSLQFGTAAFSVAENAGTAVITVTRSGGSDGPVSVNVTTADGTAVAGTNYTPTSASLFFADGQSTQTFSIPILDDGRNLGNRTVRLLLSSPAGGASLGTASTAILTITESDSGPVIVPPTQAPLQVTSVKRFGIHEQPTQLVLTFTGPLDPTTAQNVGNFTVLSPGRDGRFGTRDDVVMPIVSAAYNASNSSVTLLMGKKLDTHKSYRLTVNGTTTGGVAGPTGVLIDGNRDGQAGGDFVATVNSSTLADPVIAAVVPRGARQKVAAKSAVHAGPRVTTKWADHLKNRMGAH